MEFRFNLNEIFQHPIIEIGNSLIPPGFTGDKRALWDTQAKITQIVNAMGEASAHAQGLSKPITTADRLRNSEHRLYLLLDQAANNGKGSVTGLLKTGEKGLYVFDREGQHYQVSPPCVLDFYIHESRQRSGFGKRLFEHMLQAQQIEPVRMAIDRPSDKFLGFLNKHYGLASPVKQMNNYVVFDGFFPRSSETTRTVDADKSYTPSKKQSANGLQQGYATSPYGRYGAPRPTCSMGQIIHNDSPVIKRNQEPTGVKSAPVTNVQGQGHYGYSNQPAWQTTQSVPNMHYAYSQNQQDQVPNPMLYQQQYPQNPQQYNQQYPQNQEVVTNNYPINSGENVGQPSVYNQNQIKVEPQNQNAICGNYAMARGDAPNPSYQPNVYSPTQNAQYDAQMNLMQPALNPSENIPSNIPPQYVNYCYNQYQPTKAKEPLIPQSFDGTARKMPHLAQSMPTHELRNVAPITLQNSPSAPVNYQIPAMRNQPQDSVQGQAYNMASMPQMTNINEVPVQQYLQTQSAPQGSVTAPQQVSVPAPQQVSVPGPQQVSVPAPQQVSVPAPQQVSIHAPQQVSVSAPEHVSMPAPQQVSAPAPQQVSMPVQYQQQAPVGYQQTMPPNQAYHMAAAAQMTTQQQISNADQVTSQAAVPNQQVLNPQMTLENEAVAQQMLVQNQPSVQMIQRNFETNPMTMPANQNTGINQLGINLNAASSQPYRNNQNQEYYMSQQVQPMSQVTANVSNTVVTNQQKLPQNQVLLGNQQPPAADRSTKKQQITNAAQEEAVEQESESSAHNNSTPKADRPNSLNIEPAEEVEHKTSHDNEAELNEEEALDGDREDVDSLDGDAVNAIEQEMQKVEIAHKTGTPLSRGSKSPGIEAAGIVTPGRSTPGLTDQGYFDLKFYHNKLW